MMLGAALPLVGAAALPAVGEVAVAAGAPALATRAVTGAAGGAMFGKMGMGASMVAREAQYQVRSGMEHGEQPIPQANPQLDQLLANNDLTPFPNIQRALQESGGMRQLQHAFGSLNGQPLHPEYNAGAAPVNPQSLLTPEATTAPIEDGVSITGPTAPDEY